MDTPVPSSPLPAIDNERVLPHNEQAEVGVLGAMLLDPENAVDTAISRLNYENCFYKPAHQIIFRTIVKLVNGHPRSQLDSITVGDALANEGKLEDAGGHAYVMRLMNSVPTAANIEHYVNIVHQNAVLRRLIRTSSEILNKCYEPRDDIRELLDEIEAEVLEVTNLKTGTDAVAVGDMILDAVQYLDQLHKQDPSTVGLTTGFPDLDALITGLKPSDMVVLAARPSVGKTAFALNLACNVVLGEQRHAVGIFSLEMDANLLVLRLICSLARVNLGDIKDGALSTARWQEIMEASQVLRQAPLFVDDTGNLDIVELRAKARRMVREHKISMLIIDYLQLLQVSGVNRNATRENEVSKMSGGIKALAKELQIPILVLAQLNRQADQAGQRPRLGHLRESGAIEQDADVVTLLHRQRDAEGSEGDPMEGKESELIVAKHRNGPTGIVPLTFLPAYTRFESRSRIEEADVPEGF